MIQINTILYYISYTDCAFVPCIAFIRGRFFVFVFCFLECHHSTENENRLDVIVAVAVAVAVVDVVPIRSESSCDIYRIDKIPSN